MSGKIKTKKCTECGEEKEVSNFYSSGKIDKNGNKILRGECKSCHKIRNKRNFTLNKLIKKRAYGILKRLNNTHKPKNKCYKNVKCKIGNNTEEIYNYLLKFKKDFKRLLKEGKTPSVDRIDSNKGYVEGNIQIISFRKNSLKGLRSASKKIKGNKKSYITNNKPIGLIKKDWHTKEYKSVSECSRDLGIKRDTIIKHRDAGTISSHGYRFIDLSNY